jgi:hypothetical protein
MAGRASRARPASRGSARAPAPRPRTRRGRSVSRRGDRPRCASATRDGSARRSLGLRCRGGPSCTSRPDRSPSARARARRGTAERRWSRPSSRRAGHRSRDRRPDTAGAPPRPRRPSGAGEAGPRGRRRRPRGRAPRRPGAQGSWPPRRAADLAVQGRLDDRPADELRRTEAWMLAEESSRSASGHGRSPAHHMGRRPPWRRGPSGARSSDRARATPREYRPVGGDVHRTPSSVPDSCPPSRADGHGGCR